jgi:hypothetical protein
LHLPVAAIPHTQSWTVAIEEFNFDGAYLPYLPSLAPHSCTVMRQTFPSALVGGKGWGRKERDRGDRASPAHLEEGIK